MSEYHIKTSISYSENCCTYELPLQMYNNETEKEVIFRFQNDASRIPTDFIPCEECEQLNNFTKTLDFSKT